MSTAAVVMMIVFLGGVWGTFLWLLLHMDSNTTDD